MTKSNKSRVGIFGSTSCEAVFAIYGLNMVGAQVSIMGCFSAFSTKKVIETIKGEHLTDVIIPDDFAQPYLMMDLLKEKENLKLNNVLVLHVPIGGSSISFQTTIMQDIKYFSLKQYIESICLDELCKKYKDYPIEYDNGASKNAAWARNHYSTLWSAINYAQAVGMCQTRLDKINEALSILKAQGLTAGLSQNDYDILLNDLTRCKYAVEKALTPHRR